MELSKEVFDIDRVFAGEIPLGDEECRFDFNIMEKKVKELIAKRLGDDNYAMFGGAPNASQCHTFVVARLAENIGALPILFRSYSVEGITNTKCAIWQAVRATTAMPTFFKPMSINNPQPPIAYVDGGMGSNNPSQLALTEARRIWGRDAKVCLLSIGTGHGPALSVVDVDEAQIDTDIEAQESIFGLIRSSISMVASKIPMWSTATNIPSGVRALLKMAKALRSIAMDSESTHEHLGREADLNFPYFRFNAERGVGDIGFHDWKKFHELATHTTAYLQSHDTSKKKMDCSKCLIGPSAFYGKKHDLCELINTFRNIFILSSKGFHGSLPTKRKICWPM